jgi:hypothetical protein
MISNGYYCDYYFDIYHLSKNNVLILYISMQLPRENNTYALCRCGLLAQCSTLWAVALVEAWVVGSVHWPLARRCGSCLPSQIQGIQILSLRFILISPLPPNTLILLLDLSPQITAQKKSTNICFSLYRRCSPQKCSRRRNLNWLGGSDWLHVPDNNTHTLTRARVCVFFSYARTN